MTRHRAQASTRKASAIWLVLASMLAGSFGFISPSSAATADISLYLSAPFVQGSHVTGPGILTESFNDLTNCVGPTNVGTVTVVRGPQPCRISSDIIYGGATVGPQVFLPSTGGTASKYYTNVYDVVTFSLPSPVKYVGVWWSAGNKENEISFYSGGDLLARVSAEQITTLLSGGGNVTSVSGTHPKADYFGNPRNRSAAPAEAFGYLNLFLSGGISADRIVVEGGGFEFDNLVTAQASWSPTDSMVFVSSSSGVAPSAQTITWAPTNTTTNVGSSPLTPNDLARVTTPASGSGAISYSVESEGATGCSVDSSTGVITYTAVGTCVVRATAAAVSGTPNYFSETSDVSFVFSEIAPGAPGTPTAQGGDASVTITVVRGSGGVPTSYIVTAAPGGASCEVTPPLSSCQITGLTNGTDYNFSSTATNTAGQSAASASSTLVRPSSGSSGNPPSNSNSGSSAVSALPLEVKSVSIRASKTRGQSIVSVQLPKAQQGPRPTQVEVRILDFEGKLIRKLLVPVDEGDGTLELEINLAQGAYDTQAVAINRSGSSKAVVARGGMVYKSFFTSDQSASQPVLKGSAITAPISFIPNSSELSKESKTDLRGIAKELIASHSRIAITGYSAKWILGSAHESKIATARAYRVAKYLQDQGVDNWIYYYGVPGIQTLNPFTAAWKSEIRVLPN